MATMIQIYTTSISNRVKYTFDLYFNELLGLEYSVTTKQEEYISYQGPKFCYAEHAIDAGLFIQADPFIFSHSLEHHYPQLGNNNGLPTIFAFDVTTSPLPYDPFAAGFFMVSRYEEYLAVEKDAFGRYRYIDSIANKGEFIGKPIVHYWAKEVLELVEATFGKLKSKPRAFKYVPTIDIDHAYAFGHRKFARVVGGYLRDFRHTDFTTARLRFKVMAGRMPDPFDTYDVIHQLHSKYSLKPLYFILYADHGANDNNVSLDDPDFQALITKLDSQGTVGIHPSISSGKSYSQLENEVFGLADRLDRDITFSRQHFLKVKFPWTYRNLLRLGIFQDYSLGYAPLPGFRAGIAQPFRYYDVINDHETELIIHPVSVMDVTLHDYLGLTNQESLEMIYTLIDIVRSVNGEFVSLWHNESFSDGGRWEGWVELYEKMVQYALK